MKTISSSLLTSALILTIMLLAGCNLSASNNENESGDLDITQAYQTVDAQLTLAVGQTPVPPTKTSPPNTPEETSTSENTVSPEQFTATATPSESTATFLPTASHTPAARCDKAEAAYPSIDITIPDDTTIPAGNIFTKVWRVVNTGTCNWTAEYAVIFVDGDQMQAPDEVNIDKPVAPGQSIDIDVDMIAPQRAGTYQGNWKLRNANGDIFGIGPNANDSFWVRIVVVDADEKLTATASAAPEPDVLVSGNVTLNPDESVDLDTLQMNTSGADLAYQQTKDGEQVSGHQLVSLSGVEVGFFGNGKPTFNQCKSADKGIANIDLEATATGTHFCATTNQGLTGWVRFDGLDDENGVVTLTILTWAALE